jgi:hypothetical protein
MRNDNEVCGKVLISELSSDNIYYLLQLIAHAFINNYLWYRSKFFYMFGPAGKTQIYRIYFLCKMPYFMSVFSPKVASAGWNM